MPLKAAIVGASTEPVVHAIDARWLMAYTAGCGETLPCYLETRRPGGIQAHPLLLVCAEWPAVLAMRDHASAVGLTAEEALRTVHATHDLIIGRRRFMIAEAMRLCWKMWRELHVRSDAMTQDIRCQLCYDCWRAVDYGNDKSARQTVRVSARIMERRKIWLRQEYNRSPTKSGCSQMMSARS